MCGLAGFASLDPRAPGDEARARRMIERLAHRGPDGEGIRSMPGCALAHRRLSIIDLSDRAAQPMTNEDGSLWIVFNGEIYNHVELRRDLEPRHPFRSAGDTEVILHLYEERGDALLRDLRGMFAFALWDARRKRLLLARDRLGKKPLVYRVDAAGIAFASETAALLAGVRDCPPIDPEALATYLCLGYVPAPRTILSGVRRLPAGSALVYEEGRTTESRWWRPPFPRAATGAGSDPVGAAAAVVAPLLEESVRLRLRSDVPVGVFLSGGIDSAVVAALAAKASPQPLRTFTVVFEETGYDESALARATASAIGSEHHEIRVAPRAAEALPGLVAKMGEPLADSSIVAVHRLSEAVRGHVKVALSGDGGDEVFLGYDRYRAHRLATRWMRVPAVARRAAAATAAAVPGRRGRRNLAGRTARFLAAAEEDALARNDLWIGRFHPAELGAILEDDACGADPLEPLHHLYRESKADDALDVVARTDLSLWLPDDVLRKVDAASMACGLEVRSPLLDQEVVERAAAIPAEIRMHRGRPKAILRRIAEGLVPAEVLSARKAGFGLPVDRWLRAGPLRDLSRDLLTSPAARIRAFLRPRVAESLLDEHLSGAANHDEKIWTLLTLEIFLRETAGGFA